MASESMDGPCRSTTWPEILYQNGKFHFSVCLEKQPSHLHISRTDAFHVDVTIHSVIDELNTQDKNPQLKKKQLSAYFSHDICK